MKYDENQAVQSVSYPNENVLRRTTIKKKVKLLDVLIVQSILCVAVSCGLIISRLLMTIL
ncbi:MAG: hypothetical protein PUG90_02945 [Clostridia bacterium]|nr:hypothetical protein [Clostridia bacterium]MDY4083341.1 hypothetical protein [Eubacteriales bacterium]